jgi:hypothetical protein
MIGRRADEMHRGRDLARIFEARHRQLQIGIGEFDDRMEKRHRHGADTQSVQRLVQSKKGRLIDGLIVRPCDIRVLTTLLLCRRRQQAKEVRRAVAKCKNDVPQRTMGGRFDRGPSSIGSTPKNMSSPTITSA